MRQAHVVVSFGTSHPAARERAITPLVERVRQTWPEDPVLLAFTSPTIRRIWAGRGEEILSLPQALEHLSLEGVDQVGLYPTYLIPGEEFDRVREVCGTWRGRFSRLILALPLLADETDLSVLAGILSRQFRPSPGRAAVLMGHGSSHLGDRAYAGLQRALRSAGRPDLFLATVEGERRLEDILPGLRQLDAKRVTLAPLMLVAGDHATNDMAGPGEDSWRHRLERAGFHVDVKLRGLGELPPVRELYLDHFRRAGPAEELAYGL